MKIKNLTKMATPIGAVYTAGKAVTAEPSKEFDESKTLDKLSNKNILHYSKSFFRKIGKGLKKIVRQKPSMKTRDKE